MKDEGNRLNFIQGKYPSPPDLHLRPSKVQEAWGIQCTINRKSKTKFNLSSQLIDIGAVFICRQPRFFFFWADSKSWKKKSWVIRSILPARRWSLWLLLSFWYYKCFQHIITHTTLQIFLSHADFLYLVQLSHYHLIMPTLFYRVDTMKRVIAVKGTDSSSILKVTSCQS